MLCRIILRHSSKSIDQQLIRCVSSSSSSSSSSRSSIPDANESSNRITSQSSYGTESSKDKWDLCAGILIERLPIISKTLNPLEKQFQELLWHKEYENSLKSSFELRYEHEQKQAELLKKGEIEIDLDEPVAKQTAQDLKDAYRDELKKFKFAPRITEADKKNDVKSLDRKLESILYLLIEQKLGNKTYLMLPQGVRNDGETMRQTAERVLLEKCGNNLKVLFYGNAPCGFYKYKYPLEQRNSAVGAKIFFYRAMYKNGNIDEKILKKFEWLSHDELIKKMNKSPTYLESVQKCLLE